MIAVAVTTKIGLSLLLACVLFRFASPLTGAVLLHQNNNNNGGGALARCDGRCLPPTTRTTTTTVLFMSSKKEEEAQELLEKARMLRKEIAPLEQEKLDAVQEEERKTQEERQIKQEIRERYAALVPILKPDGSTLEERVDFAPRWDDGKSFITVAEANLPLGIILGESEDVVGAISVDEVADGSNGEASGVCPGDLLRACTACKVEMETPTWQLLAGGIGRPKTVRFMYSADTNPPFEEVMEAVASNRMDPTGRPALLVLERREEVS